MKILPSNIVMLITGCIEANINQPYHNISDVHIRYNQYMDTIIWALEKTIFSKIVFCENSNFFETHDVNKDVRKLFLLARKMGKELEIISFQGDFELVSLTNKGYGEGEIIEYAIMNSRLLRSAQYFCKITGRLKVVNIDKAFSETDFGIQYFNRDRIHSRDWIDTRFFCCEVEYYKNNLMHQYLKLSDKVVIERLFYYVLREKSKKEWRSTYVYPDFEGKSGATGKEYKDTNVMRKAILNILCRKNIYNHVYIPVRYSYISTKEWLYGLLYRIKKT